MTKLNLMKLKPALAITITVLALLSLGLTMGCQSIYNATLENVLGYEKRELLKKSVVALQAEQKDAQKEFKDAMTRLQELYAFSTYQ